MQSPFPITGIASITGLILAGGRARRLQGKDKGLIRLGNQYLIEYVIARLQPQTATILINANRNQSDYQALGYAVIADTLPDFAGPLAGLLSGLQQSQTDWLVSVPCDNPRLPANLVETMIRSANAHHHLLTVASCPGQLQPVYCLIHRSLQDSIHNYLAGGEHKVQDWLQQQPHGVVEFTDCREFENINTPAQLREVETTL